MRDDEPDDELCEGLALRGSLGAERYSGYQRLAFSSDGRWLASAGHGQAEAWDWAAEEFVVDVPIEGPTDLAWVPGTDEFAVAGAHFVQTRRLRRTGVESPAIPVSRAAHSVCFDHTGSMLLVGLDDGRVAILRKSTRWLVRQFWRGHARDVCSISRHPGANLVVSASSDGDVCCWDAATCRVTWRIDDAHRGSSISRILHATGTDWIVSAGANGTLAVWDPVPGRLVHVVEGAGHNRELACSGDGRVLAGLDVDGVLRLWRTDAWEEIAHARMPGARRALVQGLAFHPSQPLLAVGGERIQLCTVDTEGLLAAATRKDSVRYTNAKVVLLGESGVGKTGLGHVLAGEDWRETASTHGRHVWSLERSETEDASGIRMIRETLLWDLAGQAGYRLVHQLHLDEVAVALLVCDSKSELDPLSSVRYWERALAQAQRRQGGDGVPMTKLLVAARCDRGGVALSDDQLRRSSEDLGCSAVFHTSAREGWQIPQLLDAIKRSIPWSDLPQVTSNELFVAIKRYVIDQKDTGSTLLSADELFRGYRRTAEGRDEEELREAFDVCLGLLEARSLIRRLSFGGLVLLQPEYLDSYASMMVNAARDEPGGLGTLRESSVRASEFRMPSQERLPNPDQEKLLTIATIEDLLRHEVALREETDGGVLLVFPAQLTRENPALPDPPGKTVKFRFEGAVQVVYTTLVVRLSHSGLFGEPEMWRNAALFDARAGGQCGVFMRAFDDGRAELTAFHSPEASEETRALFEHYVESHLGRRARAGTIQRHHLYVCPACATPFSDAAVQKRRDLGADDIRCNACIEEPRVSLVGGIESVLSDEEAAESVAAMDTSAMAGRDRGVAVQTIAGKRETKDYDVFLCHNNEDKPAVRKVYDRLIATGILPWLDEADLRPGDNWQDKITEQIDKGKAAAVLVGRSGIGPWHSKEVDAFLSEYIERDLQVIPVILPGAQEVPKLPVLLRRLTWVDFRQPEPDPLRQLVWGITGDRALVPHDRLSVARR